MDVYAKKKKKDISSRGTLTSRGTVKEDKNVPNPCSQACFEMYVGTVSIP